MPVVQLKPFRDGGPFSDCPNEVYDQTLLASKGTVMNAKANIRLLLTAVLAACAAPSIAQYARPPVQAAPPIQVPAATPAAPAAAIATPAAAVPTAVQFSFIAAGAVKTLTVPPPPPDASHTPHVHAHAVEQHCTSVCQVACSEQAVGCEPACTKVCTSH